MARFDLTNGYWLDEPRHSGMKPGSGTAADLRGTTSANRTEFSKPHKPARPAATPTDAAGHLTVVDAITTVAGMLVFGAIAYVLLVLA